MKLTQFAQMRGMTQAYDSKGTAFVDHFLNGEQGDQIREELKLKRIQFDTAAQLSTELENVCSLLECSKREFLEMAVWDAIDRAKASFFASYEEVAGHEFGSEMTQAEVDAIPHSWDD